MYGCDVRCARLVDGIVSSPKRVERVGTLNPLGTEINLSRLLARRVNHNGAERLVIGPDGMIDVGGPEDGIVGLDFVGFACRTADAHRPLTTDDQEEDGVIRRMFFYGSMWIKVHHFYLKLRIQQYGHAVDTPDKLLQLIGGNAGAVHLDGNAIKARMIPGNFSFELGAEASNLHK